MTHKLSILFGIQGVAPSENPTARKWGMIFRCCIVLITMVLLYHHYLLDRNLITLKSTLQHDWLLCGFFVIEEIVLAYLVDNKRRFLLHNWWNIVIIVASFPPLLSTFSMTHALRILLIMRLLPPLWEAVMNILLHNRIITTVMVTAILTILWGEIFPLVDSSIKDPWDGIWLAWETVTTVGYGDVVPHNAAGRLFAILLMIFGVALTSLLTANFASFILSRASKGAERTDRKILQKLEEIEKRLDELSKK